MLHHAGRGIATLDSQGLTYIGTKYGEPFEILFPISSIYRLLFGAGENFEIYIGQDIYYFIPDERRCAVDFYVASAILNAEVNSPEKEAVSILHNLKDN